MCVSRLLGFKRRNTLIIIIAATPTSLLVSFSFIADLDNKFIEGCKFSDDERLLQMATFEESEMAAQKNNVSSNGRIGCYKLACLMFLVANVYVSALITFIICLYLLSVLS